VRKDDPPPGQEAQIDYGYLGQWTDPATGKGCRVWAFVMVLSASRHLFVRSVLAMTLAAWIQEHVLALGFFGGAPRRLVTDNLKASVIRPDLYDPKLNRTYAELAGHYGVLIDPARARKPKDKPRVERPIPYVRDSFFAGRDFASLEAMQQAAVRWSLQVAGRRACRPLGGAQPLVMFQASEQPALLALPAEPYELAVWATPKVAADCHISVDGALYSVPFRLVGRHVDVRSTPRLVEVFVEGKLVKTHVRAQRGRRNTDWSDYPPEKVAFLEKTPAWCRQRALDAGPHVGQLVADLLAGPAGHAQHHLRAAQGVLRLAERYGTARLDAACQRALTAGDPSYRTVKGILAAGLEAVPLPAEITSGPAARVPALLRGPAALTDGMPRLTTATLHPKVTTLTVMPPLSMATTTVRGWPDDPAPSARTHPADPQARRHAGDPRPAPGPGPRRRAGPPGVPRGPLRGRDRPPPGRRARFEEPTTLEEFDFRFNPKLPVAQIRDLAASRFVEAGESAILYGPVGVGKTHLAQALGHIACRRGYSVAFAKTARLLAELAGGHADRTWEQRLRKLVASTC
jgi:IstB-like ATP binding protein